MIDEKDRTDYIPNWQTEVASGEALERPEREVELEDDLPDVMGLSYPNVIFYPDLVDLMQLTPLLENRFDVVACLKEVERRADGRV